MASQTNYCAEIPKARLISESKKINFLGLKIEVINNGNTDTFVNGILLREGESFVFECNGNFIKGEIELIITDTTLAEFPFKSIAVLEYFKGEVITI